MSLLDDVSIVVTPNGYKAGTLYGVLPTATEGSEIVTNSDMESGFTGGVANNYTVSAGTPSQETSIYVSANNSQKISTSSSTAIFSHNNITVVLGTRFKASCFVRSDVSQSVRFSDYNGSGEQITQTIPANTWVNLIFYITKGNTTFIPRVQTLTNQTGYLLIDNVSVKEWTASDMDVTRATAATRVDENGLVNYAEVLGSELVVNGDFDTNINSWEQYNSVSTWDNGTIKTTSNTTVAWIRQNDILSTGNFYKIIFKAKASNISQNINIWNGAAFIDTGLSFDSINTYKEFTYYLDFTGAGGQHLILGQQVIGNGDTINFDNVSVKEVTRNNVPRIDYTGGGCPHILAEPQRTNLFIYSEDLSQSSWFTSGVTLESGQISPRGDTSAFKLSFAGANDYIQDDMVGLDISKEYTISFYAKVDSGTTTIDTGNINAGSYEVLTVTDEWQRFQVTQTPSATTRYPRPIQSNGSDTIYLWGCQFEESSYATSYIPTSGSTVTRNQDQFSRDGIGSLINDSEGILFVEAKTTYDSSTSRRISLSDGSINNRVMLEFDETTENTIKAVITTGGVNSAIMTFAASDLSQYNKIAIKYKLNDFSIWFNGTEVVTDSSGGVPTGLTQLVLDGGDGSNFFYGEVKQLQVYNTALTDMQLIQLTGTAGTDFYESYSEMAESLTYTIQ